MEKTNSRKKSLLIICNILLTLLLILTTAVTITLAVQQFNMNIGGDITFNATDVQATISAGQVANGTVADSANKMHEITITPENDGATEKATWENLEITFDGLDDVIISFTVTNNHTESNLKMSLETSSINAENMTISTKIDNSNKTSVVIPKQAEGNDNKVDCQIIFHVESNLTSASIEGFLIEYTFANTDEEPASGYEVSIDSSATSLVSSLSSTSVGESEQVTFTSTAKDTITDEQITTQEIKITDMEGGEVPYTVSNLEDSTQYSFTMPASNVTISVESQTLNIIKDYEIMGNIITSYTGPANEITVPSSYYAYKIENDGSLQFEDFQQIMTYMSDEMTGSILMGGQFTYKTADTAEYSSVIKDAQSWLTEVGGYGEEKFPITIKPLTEYTITMDDYLELGEFALASVLSPFAQVLTGRVLSFTYQVQDYEAINVNIENVYSTFSFFGNNFVFGDTIPFPFEVKDINYGEVIHCEGEGVNIQALGMPAGLPEMPGAFQGNTDITKVIITEGIEVIGASTFSGCTGLSLISIPSSITMIEEYAFEGCKLTFNEKDNGNYLGNAENLYVVLYSLKEDVDKSTMTHFTIDSNCKFIYDNVFSGCVNLEEISLPSNLISIGDGAFENCSKLTSLTIPASVKAARRNAFSGCNNIANVYYQGTVDQWLDIIFDSYDLQNYSLYTNGQLVEEVTINKNLKDHVFNGIISLKVVTIGDNVTSIGNYAFEGCKNLNTVNISENSKLISIGNWAFSQCNNLTSITIPASVVSLEGYTFNACYSLAIVYNNSSLNITAGSSDNGWIGYYAYEVVNAGEEAKGRIEEINNANYYINGTTKVALSMIDRSASTVSLEEDTTAINQYAFFNCYNLTSITIPANVTSIGDHAFDGCYNLTSVIIESDDIYNRAIGTDGWSHCGGLLANATTVKVLKTIDDGSNTYLSSTGGFTLDKTSDPTYNIYTK